MFGGTGTELLMRCNAVGTLRAGDTATTMQVADTVKDSNLCWGYIAGIVDEYQGIALSDLLKEPPSFCLPAKVSMEKLEKVVKKSLDDNPARLHMPASLLVVKAMSEAFPCQ